MQPIDGFELAMERADHLIRLYEILYDNRYRKVRRDWADRFKRFMNWPVGEAICRIDGDDSLLILRESAGIDNSHFTHDYLSELLRASIVAAVSALDRYLHDLVVHHSWKLLSQAEDDVPNELQKISLPVLVTKRALEKLRRSPEARPGGIVRKAIQEHLHRDFTFQKPDSVMRAGKLIGVSDFWRKVADEMPGNQTDKKVRARLAKIARRRNKIVHEADVHLSSRRKEVSIREISYKTSKGDVAWIRKLVVAIDAVAAAEL